MVKPCTFPPDPYHKFQMQSFLSQLLWSSGIYALHFLLQDGHSCTELHKTSTNTNSVTICRLPNSNFLFDVWELEVGKWSSMTDANLIILHVASPHYPKLPLCRLSSHHSPSEPAVSAEAAQHPLQVRQPHWQQLLFSVYT